MGTTRRRWSRILGLGLGVFVLAHAVPLAYLAATDWDYCRQVLAYLRIESITDTSFYEPLAPVRGAGGGTALERGSPDVFEPAALAEATAMARDLGSSAFVVLHRGRIVVEEYFRGDAANTTNSMSMAKTVVALLVGIAIDEGAFASEDDAVGAYVSEWHDGRAAIRVRDLLQMSSGLRRDAALWNPWSDVDRMYLGDDVDGAALAVSAAEHPGRVVYNNVNTQVLAIALARATRTSLPDYLSSRLWQPLGAADAGWWLDKPGGAPRAFCCLFARARDWARVGQLMLQRGAWGGRQLVPASWIDRMLTPADATGRYGAGVWLAELEPLRLAGKRFSEGFADPRAFRLEGKDQQRVWVMPAAQLVIVRLGPNPQRWDESWIPNTLVRGLRPSPG